MKILEFTVPPENFLPEIGCAKQRNKTKFTNENFPSSIANLFVGLKIVLSDGQKEYGEIKRIDGKLQVCIPAFYVIQALRLKYSADVEQWFDENGFVYTKSSVNKGFNWYFSIEFLKSVKIEEEALICIQ